MKTRILGVLLLLAAGSLATANCRVVHRRVVQHAVHHDNYVAPAYVAVPVVVQVPTYSVTYASPVVAPVDQELRAEIRALRQEILQLRAPQQNPHQNPEQSPPQQPPMPPAQDIPPSKEEPKVDVMKVFSSKCASCHDKAVSTAKGGGFSLLEGNSFAQLNYKQIARIGSHTYTGKMPPGKDKLTDEETAAVMHWIESLK